eukprot:6123525-Amphidinium_carterae.1
MRCNADESRRRMQPCWIVHPSSTQKDSALVQTSVVSAPCTAVAPDSSLGHGEVHAGLCSENIPRPTKIRPFP